MGDNQLRKQNSHWIKKFKCLNLNSARKPKNLLRNIPDTKCICDFNFIYGPVKSPVKSLKWSPYVPCSRTDLWFQVDQLRTAPFPLQRIKIISVLSDYRPHPKDGEGNVFSLFTLGGGSGPAGGGGVRLVSRWGGVRFSRWGGVRSVSWRGGQVQLGGGVGPAGGGSASCALLRAVCLLRSRRRTVLLFIVCGFLLLVNLFQWHLRSANKQRTNYHSWKHNSQTDRWFLERSWRQPHY